MKTPILFLVFNRLSTTKQVFEEIRKAKPSQLFIASDGGKNVKEKIVVEQIRRFVLNSIDWKCKVRKLFRQKNLGCKYAVSEAIIWFFKHVKQGIILEDDCLPSQSFFPFCEAMLEKYKDVEDIAMICGTNVEGVSKIIGDFFFSNSFNIWGWATWRRAWKDYDINMKEWKKYRASLKFLDITKGESLFQKIKSWKDYQACYTNKADTWDFQWDLHCLLNDKLSVIPQKNLITNIGMNGCHMKGKKGFSIKRYEMTGDFNRYTFNTFNDNYKKKYINFFYKNVSYKQIVNWILKKLEVK
jgi:hypothetical protein